jgi:hypothetical protein
MNLGRATDMKSSPSAAIFREVEKALHPPVHAAILCKAKWAIHNWGLESMKEWPCKIKPKAWGIDIIYKGGGRDLY